MKKALWLLIPIVLLFFYASPMVEKVRGQSSSACSALLIASSASGFSCTFTLAGNGIAYGTFFANNVGNGYTITIDGNPADQQNANDTSVAGFIYQDKTGSTHVATAQVTFVGTISNNSAQLAVGSMSTVGYPVSVGLRSYESDASPNPFNQNDITVPDYDSNATIVSMLVTEENQVGGSCPTQSSTFTLDGVATAASATTPGSCILSQFMYQTGANNSHGAYTNSIGSSGVFGQYTGYNFVVRTVMPTQGILQHVGCTTAHFTGTTPTSDLACSLPRTSQNGGVLTGWLREGSGEISTLVAPVGVNCYFTGVPQNDNNLIRWFWCYVGATAPSTRITLNVLPSSGSTDYDMFYGEDADVSPTNPMAQMNDNYINRGTPTTTQSASLQAWETGNYLAIATIFGNQSNLQESTMVAAAPFSKIYQFRFSNNTFTVNAASVAVSSVPTTISFSATSYSNSPLTQMYAFSDHTYLHPTAISGFQYFSNSSPVTTGITDPETGDGFIIAITGDGFLGSGVTITPSFSQTLIPLPGTCGSTDTQCVEYTTGIPAGAFTVQTSGITEPYMTVWGKVRSLGSLDSQGNNATNAASAAANVGLEYAASFGGNIGAGTGLYTLPSSGVYHTAGFSDSVSNGWSEEFFQNPGTYSVTWSVAPGFSASGSYRTTTATWLSTVNPPITNTHKVIGGPGTIGGNGPIGQ